MAMRKAGQDHPLSGLLATLFSTLKPVTESCSGSTSSQNEPMVVKLRHVLLLLLESYAEPTAVRTKDILTVLHVVNFVLTSLPSVFSGGHEVAVLCSLLRLLTVASVRYSRALVLEVLCLLLRVPNHMAAELRLDTLAELHLGAMELLLDAEQQLLQLALPVALEAGASPAVSVTAFSDVWARQAEAQVTFLQKNAEVYPGSGWTAAAAAAANVPQAISGQLPSLQVALSTPYTCLAQAETAAALLSRLLGSQPLMLGPATPPLVAATLLQLLVHADMNVQATMINALTTMLQVCERGALPLVDIATVAACLLEAFCEGRLTKSTSLPSPPAVAELPLLQSWGASLTRLLSGSMQALTDAGMLPVLVDRLVTVLVQACSSSKAHEELKVQLLSILHRAVQQCPTALPLACGLLPAVMFQGMAVANAAVPLVLLLGAWMGSASVDDVLKRHLQASSAHVAWLQPLCTAARTTVSAPAVQGGMVEAAEQGAEGGATRTLLHAELDSPTGRAKKKRRKMKQTQLAFGSEGHLSMQGVPLLDTMAQGIAAKHTQPSQAKCCALARSSLGQGHGIAMLAVLPAAHLLQPHYFGQVQTLVERLLLLGPSSSVDGSSGADTTATLHMDTVARLLVHCAATPSASPQLLLVLCGLVRQWLSWATTDDNFVDHMSGSTASSLSQLLACAWQTLVVHLRRPKTRMVKLLGHLAGMLCVPSETLLPALWPKPAVQFAMAASGGDAGAATAANATAVADATGAASHVRRQHVLAAALALTCTCRLLAVQQQSPGLLHELSSEAVPPAVPGTSDYPCSTLPAEFAASATLACLVLPGASLLTLLQLFPKASAPTAVALQDRARDALCCLPNQLLACNVSATSHVAIAQGLLHMLQLCAAQTPADVAVTCASSCAALTKDCPLRFAEPCGVTHRTTAQASQGHSRGIQRSKGQFRPTSSAPAQSTIADVTTIDLTSLTQSGTTQAAATQAQPSASRSSWPPAHALLPLFAAFQGEADTDISNSSAGASVDGLVALLAAAALLLRCAPPTTLAGLGKVLRRLLLLLSHEASLVRRAAVPLLRLYLRTDVLLEVYGPGVAVAQGLTPAKLRTAATLAESTLLQDVRGWLDAATNSGIRCSILQAAVSLADKLRGGDNSLMPLILLLGVMGKDDLQLCAAATAALSHICTASGCSLHQLLLGSAGSRVILEYVGRHVVDQPGLLPELLRLLKRPQEEVANAILPHVIGWLCLNRRKAEMQLFAEITNCKLSFLFANNAEHAIAYAFWFGYHHFGDFVTVVDEVMAPDEDFLSVAKVTARDVAKQVVWMAGSDTQLGWEVNSLQPPEDIIRRCHTYLESLAKLTGLHGTDAAAELLSGQTVSVLLKQIADVLRKRAVEGPPAPGKQNADGQQGSLGCGEHRPDRDSESEQLQALRALCVLVRLLGKFVSNHVLHIMAVLRAGLPGPTSLQLKMQGMSAASVFISTICKCAPQLLERMAVQAAVVLLPALEEVDEVRAAAVSILEELVLRHAAYMQGALLKMPPLPSVPGLEAVAAVLAEKQQLHDDQKYLRVLINSLRHESLSVRHAALGELKLFVHSKKNIMGEVLASALKLEGHGRSVGVSRRAGVRMNGVEELISDLVSALLRCGDNAMRTRLGMGLRIRCAECLGLLGAIDPARLSVKMPAVASLCDPLEPLAFEIELVVRHLVRVLETTSDITTLDFATYAIQSVLQKYSSNTSDDGGGQVSRKSRAGSEGAGPSSEPEGLFKALPADIKPIVAPYLTSRFILEDKFKAVPEEGVVFGSMQHSFRRWLERWLKNLIRCTSGPSQPAYSAVTSVLKWDLPLMTFLLPQVVHNVVARGLEQGRKIAMDEIMAVLQAACHDGEAPPAEMELYLQALFMLLDVLGRWVKDAWTLAQVTSQASDRTGARGEASEVLLPAQAKLVSAFLAAIPKDTLALAAFRCGAHARALQYYETHARQVVGGGLNPAAFKVVEFASDQVSFLLEVYGQLEEPDGLSGIIHLRQGGLTHGDQILAAEKAGAWSEALALYEQGMAAQAAETFPASGAGGVPKPTAATVTAARLPHSTGFNTAATTAASTMGSSLHSTLPSVSVSVSNASGGGGLSSMQQGHLRCLLQMGHLQALLQCVDGQLSRQHGLARVHLAAAGVAAAWRLGRWELLQEYVTTMHIADRGAKSLGPQEGWEVTVGCLLAALQPAAGVKLHSHITGGAAADAHTKGVADMLAAARADILAILPAISTESYVRAYPAVMRLHMLQELQDVAAILQGTCLPNSNKLRRLRWPERLAATQATLATQEPLLSLRRQLAEMVGDAAVAGACWLQQAKLCRATGHHEAAATAVLEALARDVPGAVLERAKLLWHMDKQQRAISELQAARRRWDDPKLKIAAVGTAAAGGGSAASSTPHVRAKVALQLCRWVAAQGQLGYLDLKRMFDEAVALEPGWEKGHFQYARYLDQLYQDAKRRQTIPKDKQEKTDRLGGKSRVALGEERMYFEYLPEIVTNYGKSVQCGHRHALQALPRLLTLYCDFGSDVIGRKTMTSKERNAGTQVVNSMKELAKRISAVAWLITLPQLISRICHANKDVNEVIQTILVRVTEAYPHHALWSLVACHRSAHKHRQTAASNIMHLAKRNADDATQRVYAQFGSLVDHLIRLCHWQPSKSHVRKVKASQEFEKLVAILPVEVMVPVQEMFALTLPPVPTTGKGSSASATNTATGPGLVTIARLKDEIVVMSSMQKPKKITFKGSDGREYPFLAKPKDDLRKDYRLMDFAAVLNSLLSKEVSGRRRDLKLRTYSVVPLTEDCGILQWINNLLPFKNACEEVYVAEGLYKPRETSMNIKRIYDEWKEPNPNSKAKLMTKVLSLLPPRMHKWLLTKFPEPATWLQARLNFTRTNAAWCMTGHVLGLGDRHGENIMIDCTTGDTVHVDFGCLFDRGLMLEIPEMVPFRLTQNVIDCFGVTGVEGTFRKCTQVTLAVMRQHKETLMTCAETFLHDPLVDWTKQPNGRSSSHAVNTSESEQENPQAKDALTTMAGRLSGTLLGVLSQPSLPLSCEGQAHRLISEAVDKNNLGSMYIWWMPWF